MKESDNFSLQPFVLQSSLVQEYVQSKHCSSALNILVHVFGASPGSTNIVATLRRLCHELNTRFSLNKETPEDYKLVGMIHFWCYIVFRFQLEYTFNIKVDMVIMPRL